MSLHLNGWQRLWLLLTVIWTVLVAVVQLLLWPAPPSDEDILSTAYVGTQIQPTPLKVVASEPLTAPVSELSTLNSADYQRLYDLASSANGNERARADGLIKKLTPTERNAYYEFVYARVVKKEGSLPSDWVDVATEETTYDITAPNGKRVQLKHRGYPSIADVHQAFVSAGVGSGVSLSRGRLRWRLRQLGGVSLVWFIPPAALYALGWGVAWVRRGFRQQ